VKSLSLRFRIRAGSRQGAAASVERVVAVEPHEDSLVIGRRRGNGVELPFADVSDRHARLSRGDQDWLLADLGSANGTYVNGLRLTPFVVRALSVGDVVRLATVEMVFEGEDRAARGVDGQGVQTESTATLARRLVSDLFGTCRPSEVARLVVLDGPACGRELRLEAVGCRYRIGRGTRCNLAVPDDDLSREHAEFERRWDGVFVRDLNSKNGVSLLGERLVGERRLSDGDVLRLGQTTFRLEDPEDRYLRQMEADEALACQAAQTRVGGKAVLSDTHTSSTHVSSQAALPNPVAATQSGSVGNGRRSSRHASLALMVIAALVLVGAIGIALSFIIGS
jgi:pSer/pThr/pTyr-binding forkhead associated (FHA) protein